MIRTDMIDRLPVRTVLPAVQDALDRRGAVVLCAPPGTGKTTLVPLVLAGLVPPGPGEPVGGRDTTGTAGAVRRVVVAEPRRIAVRAAARRMAWLLGEPVGERVGFTVRGERVVGPGCLVEVVTTGVLLQRLQRDPELAGVDVVVLDECHERHLDADTAAAFLLDVRAALRPELRLVAASATTDAEGWSRLLDAPVVEAPGVAHPVRVVWAPPPGLRPGGSPARPTRPPHGTWVDPALLEHVAAVVRRALREADGDVLCFLPGAGEIGRVAGLVEDGADVEVLRVHGRSPAAVQDAVLSGGTGRRRVVLATAVAESSLTVPGVRVVVDAGLAREPRTDHARGLSALTTVRASLASARQRAGRAGREAPGVVYRCWPEAEHGRLPRFPSPEIAVADLTAFALRAACWGDPDATGLALLDPPPRGAMAAAREVLRAIGAVDRSGRATRRGEHMARLARALLDAVPLVGARRAAEVVALLSEEPPREYGDEVAAVWRAARRGGDAYAARWRREARRLQGALPGEARSGGPAGPDGSADLPDDAAAGLVVALAFPERVARAHGERTYLMVSGTRAELAGGSGLRDIPWLAVAVADRPVGAASARVRLAAAVDEEAALRAARALYTEDEEVTWSGERHGTGDVVARRVERLGAVELASSPLERPDPALVRRALLEGLRREGPELLRWSREARSLRERLVFLHRELGEPWPDVSDEALLARAEEWLGPVLDRARRRADLERTDAGQLLNALLPWATGDAARLAELAPERIEVPSGSRIRVDYGGERPVLAVKLQEVFGWHRTPRLADGRVPLLVHLLSPAGRPAAVTADLASFWRDGYRSVRAELRGRYPRHPWPEDPMTAEPTRRTAAAARRAER
ncbi:MAG TPA: ATP-dependent helicase HrpB [Streptomyces sp.]|nr:ATP-dependent helicase HrpB [Streptomyces sp.]